jgi:proteasome lid subunit RPN8/RPN11
MKSEVIAAMERHAWSDLPNEVCGFVYKDHYFLLKARVSESCRFEADPAALALALTTWGEPIAVFHSHPNGDLRPSLEDLASSYYPNSIMIIGSIIGKKFRYRMYRIQEGTYEVVEPVQLEPAPAVQP